MGLDLAADPRTAALFAQADEILGWSITEICQGPREVLDRTLYTQPALFTVTAALAQLALAQQKKPDLVAGHSLGEYTALFVAGVFDFATGLTLVRERAALMDAQSAGAMSALIGFDREKLEALCAESPGVVIANDNNAIQAVISGTPERVAEVGEQIQARRVVPLAVSGAFHSPLMAPAAEQFAGVLDRVVLRPAQIPVLQNVAPLVLTRDPDALKSNLKRQIDHSVRWRETMITMANLGIMQLVEIGPGTVLTGLARRTHPDLSLVNLRLLTDLYLSPDPPVPGPGTYRQQEVVE